MEGGRSVLFEAHLAAARPIGRECEHAVSTAADSAERQLGSRSGARRSLTRRHSQEAAHPAEFERTKALRSFLSSVEPGPPLRATTNDLSSR